MPPEARMENWTISKTNEQQGTPGAPVCACFPGNLTRKGLNMATTQRTSDCVPLNWNEVYYTNCPLVSASNVDQELGWTREEYKKIGVKYALPALAPREQLVPALHPQHGQPDPLRRVVPAHPRARGPAPHRLLGVTHAPPEGGCMLVRARDDIYRMKRPAGQEDRPDQEPEHHQERLVAHPGAPGHRADAPAQRHDDGRRRDRRVPVPG